MDVQMIQRLSVTAAILVCVAGGVMVAPCAAGTISNARTGEWEPYDPYDMMYAVGEDNRVFFKARSEGAFHTMPWQPPLPAGERIVGMDIATDAYGGPPDYPHVYGGFLFLAASGQIYGSEWDPGPGVARYVKLGPPAPVPLVGSSIGFDVGGAQAVVTSTTGQNLMFDRFTNSWSVRPPLSRATAAIGALAHFSPGPWSWQHPGSPWEGIDITDGTMVRIDPATGTMIAEGQAKYIPGNGDPPTLLPLAGATLAGFDAILYASIWDPSANPIGYFGGMALNEPGAHWTRLYPLGWGYPGSPDGWMFYGPTELITNEAAPVLFTAIAFSPEPGAFVLLALAGLVGCRRRRY